MSTASVEAFSRDARAWLEEHAPAQVDRSQLDERALGAGDVDVSVFHSLSFEAELELLQRLQSWTTTKATRGYHAITASPEYGGLGLDREHARAFAQLEAEFDTPPGHELHSVTTRVGEGWKVALTTLGFERDHSESPASGRSVGGSWGQLLGIAQLTGAIAHPVVRQQLMRVYSHHRIEGFVNRRAADLRRAGAPAGPEGSLGKLLWTEGMTLMSEVAGAVLGARLTADGGERGTFAWNDHVLGAPGYRIAGGSDETQRNIIGERVLGLPGEPRVDKSVPWSAVPR